jgi:mannose-1-phosphate guanylyltransferase
VQARQGPGGGGEEGPPTGSETRGREGPWALVLAGGDGRRLQVLTQTIAGAPIPKQYCRIAGDCSLLEATLARIGPLVPPERTLVVVNRNHLDLALPQLAHLPRGNVLVQPENRDTGPGIVFGLLQLAARRPRAPVIVFPSDHYIDGEVAFRAHVALAARLVDRAPARIALLGIRATHAEPGYGYIEPGAPIVMPGHDSPAAYRVKAFHEKPSVELAGHLLGNGGLWNSFVMVFRMGRLLSLLRRTRRADVDALRSVMGPAAGYDGVRRWNFSADFLSQVPRHLAVVPVEGVLWSDWGTPEAVERTLAALNIEPIWRRRPPGRHPGQPGDGTAARAAE